MEQFEGRVAVVTGAGSGIGRALARRAAGEGMRVVIADVEVNALEEAAAEAASAGAAGGAVRVVIADGEVNALEEAAAEVESAGAEVVVAPPDVSRPEQVG